MTGVQRIHNDDGSVTFAATFDSAEALRADPEVLCTLEDSMRGAVETITGEAQYAAGREWQKTRHNLAKAAKAFTMLMLMLGTVVIMVGLVILFFFGVIAAIKFFISTGVSLL